MTYKQQHQLFRKYKIFHKLFSVIWQDSKEGQLRIIAGMALVIVGSVLNLTLPWCLKFIIEYFNRPDLFSTLVLLLTSYGILWLVAHLTIGLRQIILYRAFERGIHRFAAEVFQKILNLSLKYHVSNTTGSIMNSFERAQMSIPTILFCLIFIIFPMVIESIIAVSISWYYYGVTMAVILFSIFLCYALFTWLCIPWVVEAQRQGNKCLRRVSDYMTDVLMNVEGIHYHSAQKLVSLECEKRLMARENAMTKQLVRTDAISVGQAIIAGIGFICMTLVVGFKVMNKQLVVSDFVLINGYLIQFLIPLSAIGVTILRNIREGFTRMEDVMALLNENETIVDNPLAEPIKQNTVDISFNNVSFIYPDKENHTLEDISFYIPEGKSVAIVGANGSGKSTIMKLLYRLFDVSKGQITIQGEDIRNIKLSELRQLIGIVPQEVFLLNDTIYSNILFGMDKNAVGDDFEKVTQITNIEEWVNTLPDKYMTVVGEQGIKLSGGEKKRISIARTLLRNPRVLILDEAMASLDVDTEFQILDHIQRNYEKLTRIVITHNVKYLPDADTIIYLENGGVGAEGNHNELLTKNEGYRKVWQK